MWLAFNAKLLGHCFLCYSFCIYFHSISAADSNRLIKGTCSRDRFLLTNYKNRALNIFIVHGIYSLVLKFLAETRI